MPKTRPTPISCNNNIIIIKIIIQLFIIYVLSQQPKGQLQTQHSVETGNYITHKHNIKTREITGKSWWKKIIIIIINIILFG
jgi:hypothetical protein